MMADLWLNAILNHLKKLPVAPVFWLPILFVWWDSLNRSSSNLSEFGDPYDPLVNDLQIDS